MNVRVIIHSWLKSMNMLLFWSDVNHQILNCIKIYRKSISRYCENIIICMDRENVRISSLLLGSPLLGKLVLGFQAVSPIVRLSQTETLFSVSPLQTRSLGLLPSTKRTERIVHFLNELCFYTIFLSRPISCWPIIYQKWLSTLASQWLLFTF